MIKIEPPENPHQDQHDYYQQLQRTDKGFAKALASSYRMLGRSDKTEYEIRTKLKDRKYDLETIDNVIGYLELQEYIDDKKFTANFIQSKMEYEKYGPQQIKQKLKLKGVNEEIIEFALEEIDEESFIENAQKIAASRKRIITETPPEKRYNKLANLLVRKGYSFGIASQITKKILDEIREEEQNNNPED